jgi:plastocyanin
MTLKKHVIPALVISMILGGCSVPGAISQRVPRLQQAASSAAGQLSPELASGAGQLLASDQAIVVGDDESLVTKDVEVRYTDLGFDPSEIEVEANTRIVFLNQSTDRLWVKSTQPFYSFKPKFDAGAGVKAGGWTSVIFNQAGTWQYHNYLNPQQKGTITVVDVVE